VWLLAIIGYKTLLISEKLDPVITLVGIPKFILSLILQFSKVVFKKTVKAGGVPNAHKCGCCFCV